MTRTSPPEVAAPLPPRFPLPEHDRLDNGGLRDPAGGSVTELGHTPVGGLELGLEVRILSLQLAHRLNDLVEELVDLSPQRAGLDLPPER